MSPFFSTNLSNPIGIFDSGIGGTSIWREIHQMLPHENTLYLADSLNAPYGVKSKDEIVHLCEKNTEFLLHENSKIIVVACNTATTNAIKHLRNKYPVSFIGIEPAIKPASIQTKTGAIGILATKGTLSSELFYQTSQSYSQEIKMIEQEGTGLVELIESGQITSSNTVELLKSYLKPMLNANIDYLVLGCSHYPYLIQEIRKIIPKNIVIIDSGEAVARQTKNILIRNNQLNKETLPGECMFLTNGEEFILKGFIGEQHDVQYLNF